ncbi:hypothetical protein LSAT2_029277 [Lamellibrachia satsuma]|nr:hypothetical protein LSAT2_029277 [Lamellibrachia satsuma]
MSLLVKAAPGVTAQVLTAMIATAVTRQGSSLAIILCRRVYRALFECFIQLLPANCDKGDYMFCYNASH